MLVRFCSTLSTPGCGSFVRSSSYLLVVCTHARSEGAPTRVRVAAARGHRRLLSLRENVSAAPTVSVLSEHYLFLPFLARTQEVLDHVMQDAELWTGLLARISRAYPTSLWHHDFIKATRSTALVVLNSSPQGVATGMC